MLTIDTDVPFPPRHRRGKNPLLSDIMDTLQVGQSVLVSLDNYIDRGSATRSLINMARIRGIRIVTNREGPAMRVWRKE